MISGRVERAYLHMENFDGPRKKRTAVIKYDKPRSLHSFSKSPILAYKVDAIDGNFPMLIASLTYKRCSEIGI